LINKKIMKSITELLSINNEVYDERTIRLPTATILFGRIKSKLLNMKITPEGLPQDYAEFIHIFQTNIDPFIHFITDQPSPPQITKYTTYTRPLFYRIYYKKLDPWVCTMYYIYTNGQEYYEARVTPGTNPHRSYQLIINNLTTFIKAINLFYTLY
jgi:hypothetical protein